MQFYIIFTLECRYRKKYRMYLSSTQTTGPIKHIYIYYIGLHTYTHTLTQSSITCGKFNTRKNIQKQLQMNRKIIFLYFDVYHSLCVFQCQQIKNADKYNHNVLKTNACFHYGTRFGPNIPPAESL